VVAAVATATAAVAAAALFFKSLDSTGQDRHGCGRHCERTIIAAATLRSSLRTAAACGE
jgi:hypothetical protein